MRANQSRSRDAALRIIRSGVFGDASEAGKREAFHVEARVKADPDDAIFVGKTEARESLVVAFDNCRDRRDGTS